MSVYIVGAKRTAIGAFGGKLAQISATELGAIASVAAIKSVGKPITVDSCIYGNVLQTSSDAAYLSRHVGLKSGLSIDTPAITINRLCGSGFQSVISGAQEILLNEAQVVLTGGTENMSQAPYALRNVRSGTRYGVDLQLEDTLAHGLVDSYPKKTPMAITAENLGKKYNISREECDEFAVISQKRWVDANKAGVFKAEITPVEIKTRKGVEVFQTDEHPRLSTIEQLSKLKPIFVKDVGVVTAGNASGINDGAASIVLASEKAVSSFGLKPLAKLVSWHYAGVDPSIMGIGPVPAIKGALKKAGLTLDDMSLVEVNEAFAVQYLAVEKELKLDRSKTNTNGGAIAIGHPLGASGARITAHLVHELIRTGGRYGLGSACIGGGQDSSQRDFLMNERQLFVILLFFTTVLFSAKLYWPFSVNEDETSYKLNDIDFWLMNISVLPKLLANISPNGSRKGIVIASPSRDAPNYYFHWVRDSGIVLREINYLYKTGNISQFENILWDYAFLSRDLQRLPAIGWIGEPKFQVDGTLFNGPWCRPQTDGPALAASLLIEFAFNYLEMGGSIEKVSTLYDSKLPTDSVIKMYLEYVSHYWNENTCDLWEEVVGDFFYTRMVQRSSLIHGAEIARKMNDTLAADWYAFQALQISISLEHYWSEAKGYIVSGLKNSQDIRSGLDISIILGVIHSSKLPTFAPDDDRVLSSFVHLVGRFAQSYNINKVTHDRDGHRLGVAIGRYPEDVYNGTGVSSGNPWYLATASLAEFLYNLAYLYQKKGRVDITSRSLPFFRDFLSIKVDLAGSLLSKVIHMCRIKGDEFLRRIKFYEPLANLSEQYDSLSGRNLGARDLTWSYASILSASRARRRSIGSE